MKLKTDQEFEDNCKADACWVEFIRYLSTCAGDASCFNRYEEFKWIAAKTKEMNQWMNDNWDDIVKYQA